MNIKLSVLIGLAIATISCGSGNDSLSSGNQSCAVGVSVACTCSNGKAGAQVCKSDGTFDICTCDSQVDSGAGGMAGSSGSGGSIVDSGTEVLDSTSTVDVLIQDVVLDVFVDNQQFQDVVNELEASVVCVSGSLECNGKVPRSCDQNGVWQNGNACEFVCSNGLCKGTCNPGTKKCDGKSLMLCDTNGDWQVLENCAVSCDSNANPPVCIGHWCCTITSNNCSCSAQVGTCLASQASSCSSFVRPCCWVSSLFPGTWCRCQDMSVSENCDQIVYEKNTLVYPAGQYSKFDKCPL
jgi:hypothetical protein